MFYGVGTVLYVSRCWNSAVCLTVLEQSRMFNGVVIQAP